MSLALNVIALDMQKRSREHRPYFIVTATTMARVGCQNLGY